MRIERFVYSIAILLSSALLFLIQPLAARFLLPTFGGSPQVWSASMLFFQILLLGGYAYAHFSNLWLGPMRQRYLHLTLLFLAALTLPFTSSSSFFNFIRTQAPMSPVPSLLVLLALGGMVGMVFFVISSNSPLLQRWFASTGDPNAKNPYFLYAASNFGSMVGLIAYPFIIEPRLGLMGQTLLFEKGFWVLVVLFLACGLLLKPSYSGLENSSPPSGSDLKILNEAGSTSKKVEWSQRWKWMFFGAVPSSLLLGSTTFLTSNVAPVPMLWVVPLALYLLTFMLAFAARPRFTSVQLSRFLPLLVTPLVLPLVLEATEPIAAIAGFHLVVVFVASWMCHAKLAESRPGVQHLTEFFLWMSVGGVLGGLFNSLIAPVLFKTYLEYPLAISLALALRANFGDRKLPPKELWLRTALPVVAMMVLWFSLKGLPPSPLRHGAVLGIPLALAFASMDFRYIFATNIGGILLLASLFQVGSQGQILSSHRSFFGVHRIMKETGFISLVHGTTTHGRQSRNPDLRDLPLTYYHPSGPVGQIFRSKKFMAGVKKIGMVGLGVGSLAAYGKKGQTMTYFEIDPEVLRIARDTGDFTFLKNSKAAMRYVLGDARLTLAKEPNQSYDFLVLDAFSSDAIPTHLMTAEALAMYRDKLKPGGVIAFHISNRFLELAPVLAATAKSIGLMTWDQTDGPTDEESAEGKTQSHWALLSPTKDPLKLLTVPAYWSPTDAQAGVRPWTDEFSNVLGSLNPDH